MNRPRLIRLAMVALIPAAITLGMGNVQAQSPPAVTPPPAAAPAPAEPPAPAPVQTADPFGEEITLTQKPVVIIKGNANWDSAFDTLMESFKSLSALLDKQGIKPTGNSMIVYTSTDDTGFKYLADMP